MQTGTCTWNNPTNQANLMVGGLGGLNMITTLHLQMGLGHIMGEHTRPRTMRSYGTGGGTLMITRRWKDTTLKEEKMAHGLGGLIMGLNNLKEIIIMTNKTGSGHILRWTDR